MLPKTSQEASAEAEKREDLAQQMLNQGFHSAQAELEYTAALLRQLESSLRVREALDAIAQHAQDKGLGV
jgi:hypothetical protein